MLGVVLCGGQSSRMGSDKGLLKQADKTWVQLGIDKLNHLKIPVIISVNKHQYLPYSSAAPNETLIIDNELLQLRGPLRGVLSSHLKYPAEDLLILACDMPLIDIDLIKRLLEKEKTETNSDAFIYSNEGHLEPLPGIYKAKGLAHIHHLYATDQLRKHSMKYMLEHISTSFTAGDDKRSCFRNFNTQAAGDDL